MAPELVSDPDHVSEKADVWSLGMVLWEMLTLQAPFQSLAPQQIIAGASSPLRQPSCRASRASFAFSLLCGVEVLPVLKYLTGLLGHFAVEHCPDMLWQLHQHAIMCTQGSRVMCYILRTTCPGWRQHPHCMVR